MPDSQLSINKKILRRRTYGACWTNEHFAVNKIFTKYCQTAEHRRHMINKFEFSESHFTVWREATRQGTFKSRTFKPPALSRLFGIKFK